MKVGCSRCGANIEFMPATQKFHCNHCGADSDIQEYEGKNNPEILFDSKECFSSRASIPSYSMA